MPCSSSLCRDAIVVPALLIGLFATSAKAVTYDTVPVGNTGNVMDIATGYGGVNYPYEIGRFEVTAGQYTDFLNAVAKFDPYNLWHSNMELSDVPHNPTWGQHGPQIVRSGFAGSFQYNVAPDWENRPVNHVSMQDAMRFVNWMHNGQPTTGVLDASTTEDGTYTLNGVAAGTTSVPDNAEIYAVVDSPEEGRQPDWTWALPTLDEWYKAAYHKNDGDTSNYFAYATGSDALPNYVLPSKMASQGCVAGCTVDASGNVITPDPGNFATHSGPGGGNDISGIGPPYYRTEVGEWENSPSPYGAFDMAGNVQEMTTTITVEETTPGDATGEMARMGGTFVYSDYMNSGFIIHSNAFAQNNNSGFRMIRPSGGAISCENGCDWAATEGGNWKDGGNWIPALVPDAGGHKAVLGGSIQADSTVFTDVDRTLAEITFDNGSASYNVSGQGTVKFAATSGTAKINVDDGDHEFQARVQLDGNTTTNVSTGNTLAFNNLLDLNGNTLTKTGLGTIAVNNDLLSGNGGTLDCAQGVCSGVGTISGNVNTSGGTIAPGNSPGTLTIDGNYNQTSGGTLAIEIGGTSAGIDHDVLNVLGDASLAGTLSVSLIDGFTPSGGNTFKVLTATGGLNDAGLTLGGSDAASFTMNIDTTNDWIMLMTAGAGQPGDYNGNGVVDAADYTIFRDNLGGNSAVLGGNGSGAATVVQADYDLWKQNFGSSGTGSSAAVPEPCSYVLMTLGLLALVACRGRQKPQ